MQRRPAIARKVETYESPHLSLSQHLAEMRAALNRSPELIGEVYDALFREHFGCRSRRKKHSTRNNLTFGRVFAWCANRDVRVPDFISANMLLWSKHPEWPPFTPQCLQGERAIRRYNGVLGRANRRFGRGSVDVFNESETLVGRVRAQLVQSEQAIATVYVSSRLAGDLIRWPEAVAAVDPSIEWLDFQSRRGVFIQIAALHGSACADREMEYARLRAAWSIAEGVRHGLGDLIGIADFSWGAFARLLEYVANESPKREKVQVSESMSGSVWGNW